jgi:ABC-type uncharacterized transport system, permease component
MKLYLKFLAMHLKGAMQYKASFVMTAIGQFMVSFTTLFGIWFMFSRFNQVEGFALPEVLLCYATVLAAFSVAECFARGFDSFPRLIGNGEFDRILVRPRSAVFQVLAARVDFSRGGRLLQAVLVLMYAIPNSGIVWTGDKVFTLVLMLLCGTVVFFCLFLIYAGFSFFTIEGLEFMNIFTHGGQEFGRYPFAVYGKEVLAFFTYVIPLALFQYYPLLYLLGRETGPLYMLSPLLSLLFILPAYGLWRLGLRRYVSTGS